jgi:putative spermidine/putrescine transport system substrate-binding protein
MTSGNDEKRGLRLPRRSVLAGLTAATVSAIAPPRARAAEEITVADPGGVYTTAWQESFYTPFEQETGIHVKAVARDAEPTSQIKAIVEARSYVWDVVSVALQSWNLLSNQKLLEPLDWQAPAMAELIPNAHQPDWMGTNVYGTILAYRSDTMKTPPASWADFFNPEKFPGRRALPKAPISALEVALLADGVPGDKLYPLDVDRAFRKLDQIKPHIDVWWTSYPQTTQLLLSGEVDMLVTSNARAQAAIDGGAPVTLVWNQGLYGLEGWVIPKGTPRAAAAKKFIAFCARPKQQALYTKTLSYGPTNPKAFEFIPAARAEQLPTAPDHFKLMTPVVDAWWGANKDAMYARYNAWLLK